MKSFFSPTKKSVVYFGAAVLLFLSASAAQAQILLDVEISPSGTVTIIATGTEPGTDVSSGNDFFDGVDLLGFFSNDVGFNPVGGQIVSTLTTGAGTSTPVFDSAYGDTYSLGDAAKNLNLYASNGYGVPETFSTGTTAFTGTFTIDLSGNLGDLPGPTGSGTIISGANGNGTQTVIGSWQVVSAPEPSAWMLISAGLALVVIYRGVTSRRTAAAKPVAGRSGVRDQRSPRV